MYTAEQLYSISLQATYHIRSDATIINIVAQELGAAINPRLAAEPIPPGISVYSLLVPLFRVVCVAAVKDALLSPAVFTFLPLLKATLRVK